MTDNLKFAPFGSVSTNTLRPEDLLPAFASELEYHVKRNEAALGEQETSRLLNLVREAETVEDYASEDTADILDMLEAELQTFAPPYAYFGAHPDDGADFGYWLTPEFDENFDGLRVNDTSEVPADYSGEVVHVNDHGNMTLYSAHHGELREIWGLV